VIAQLVYENVRHRPMRTALSALLIAVPVTLILTLVGLSQGFVRDSSSRARGIGADIFVRAPDAAVMSFAANTIPEKLVARLAQVPHVAIATGVASQSVSGWIAVTGIDYPEFSKMSGGFTFLQGHAFQKPDDVVLDTFYAGQVHARAGDHTKIFNRDWNVAGIVEPGKLAHIFVPLAVAQEMASSTGKLSQIYLKLDDSKNTQAVMDQLNQLLPGYHIYPLEELLSLTSADKVPFLNAFIRVIIGVGVIIGFAVVSLSMYMAVLQRTREIGILKSLGGSKSFVLRIILAEAFLLGLAGTVLGIILSFGTRALLMKLVPASLPQAVVPEWWPIAGAIVMSAALLGALYPGMIAVRQDPIEALAYE
jgi:putative ABC transport system permease protein